MSARPKTLIYVHSRGFKPGAADLGAICRDAIRAGIVRDRPEQVAAFDAVGREMAYYGDLNLALLSAAGLSYDAALDLRDRHYALKELGAVDKAKKFTLARYDQLPGKTSLKEFAADVAAPVLKGVGLSELVIRKLVPELGHYWQGEGEDHRTVLARVATRLGAALRRGDDILVLSHGIGAVVVYDALWQLCHESDGTGSAAKIESWITLGSPLGNETVKGKLKGAAEKGPERYPANIVRWHNVAAEDDYMSHDKTVADDFSPMLKQQLISAIQDHKIYSLAVRFGKSNPHSSVGYLIHPRVIRLIADWLEI